MRLVIKGHQELLSTKIHIYGEVEGVPQNITVPYRQKFTAIRPTYGEALTEVTQRVKDWYEIDSLEIILPEAQHEPET